MRIADNQFDAGDGGDFLRGALRVTSGNQDLRIGILAMNAADGGARVLVGRRRHRAGVENNHLRVIRRSGALQAAVQQLPLDGSAVGLCSPAPEVFNVISRHRIIISSANLRLSFTLCAPRVYDSVNEPC